MKELLVVKYRIQQMRVTARRHGKLTPSAEEIRSAIPDDLICPICKRQMNWLNRDGVETVITLQHDRDGGWRMICRSCNARHASFPGDSFYDHDQSLKICPGCRTKKPYDEFHTDNSPRWKHVTAYCKTCCTERHRKWTRNNKDTYNEYQRKYRAKRKAAGNPVRRPAKNVNS